MKQNRNDKKYEKRKWYKYHCNKCYINEDWIEETTLSKGIGCNACCVPSKKVLLSVNTIYDKATWMIKLGVSEEDAKKYSFRSTNEIEVTCPHCGRPKITTPDKIYSHKSIGCNCGDNISYPNKYKHEFYNQLLIQGQIKNYIPEYKIKNRNYDMFIELNNGETLIDENHGEQHGKFIKSGNITIVKYIRKCFNINNKRDEIKNDSYKCWLAYENGIDNYIQSDCFISDSDYMKHNIENSILSKMFDLSKIDWNKCEEYALKKITKEICDYWHEHREVNKEYITTTDLIDICKFDRSTIIKYLKKGNKIGWCSYDPKEEQRLGAMRSNALKRNKVLVYDLNMNYITEGESASWLSRNSVKKLGVKISQSKISDVATGKRSSYKGFIFKYAKDVDK